MFAISNTHAHTHVNVSFNYYSQRQRSSSTQKMKVRLPLLRPDNNLCAILRRNSCCEEVGGFGDEGCWCHRCCRATGMFPVGSMWQWLLAVQTTLTWPWASAPVFWAGRCVCAEPGTVCRVLTLVKFISPLNRLYVRWQVAGNNWWWQDINFRMCQTPSGFDQNLVKHTWSFLLTDLMLKCSSFLHPKHISCSVPSYFWPLQLNMLYFIWYL